MKGAMMAVGSERAAEYLRFMALEHAVVVLRPTIYRAVVWCPSGRSTYQLLVRDAFRGMTAAQPNSMCMR
jgi:hypothetical protein